ncbi:sulfite exporter TauE/SafE family protein [Streptomyces sp. MAR4 CNX-425]|uniref:sulfite exporter TauE/SafE family protein n=1 Tax=Streptomyces sp. MAR4 CNX-425 TaxID=3406343 RepID=UPI003B50BF67
MSTLILALAAGALTGLALGALGGGGSVLAVPALIYVLGYGPVAATTASLVIVAVTSAAALAAHAAAGRVRWRTGLLFAAAGAGPAMLGGALAERLPAAVLTAAFAGVAAAAAVCVLRCRRGARGGAEDAPRTAPGSAPGSAARRPAAVRPGRAAAAGAGLGAVTGVVGVGGGFLAVPALTGVLGLRMRVAVGTSLLVITVNSLAALATRAGPLGSLDWAVVGPFTGLSVLGAWGGKRLAGGVSGETLRRIFAVTLLAVAAVMLADAAVRA